MMRTGERVVDAELSGHWAREVLAECGLIRCGPRTGRWGAQQVGADAVITTQLRPSCEQLARDLIDDHNISIPEIGDDSTGYDDEALSCEEPVAT